MVETNFNFFLAGIETFNRQDNPGNYNNDWFCQAYSQGALVNISSEHEAEHYICSYRFLNKLKIHIKSPFTVSGHITMPVSPLC